VGAGVVSGLIYVFSDHETGERYDPAVDEWKLVPGVPTERESVVSEAVGGVIYVIGGESAETEAAVGTVEAFTP
jgi:hypothetical protein